MTNEEAIKVLEKQFDKLCGNSLHQNAEKIDIEDALWMGIEALRSQKEYEEFKTIWDMYGGEFGIVEMEKELERLRESEKNEPLTLEELRGMYNQPVFIVGKEGSGWAIVDWHGVNKSWMYFSKTGTAEGMSAKVVVARDYGEKWIAYRKKPEREGWLPIETNLV